MGIYLNWSVFAPRFCKVVMLLTSKQIEVDLGQMIGWTEQYEEVQCQQSKFLGLEHMSRCRPGQLQTQPRVARNLSTFSGEKTQTTWVVARIEENCPFIRPGSNQLQITREWCSSFLPVGGIGVLYDTMWSCLQKEERDIQSIGKLVHVSEPWGSPAFTGRGEEITRFHW